MSNEDKDRRIKTNSFTEPFYDRDKDQFLIKKTVLTYEFDSVLRVWNKTSEVVTLESLEKHGLKKRIELGAIIIQQIQSRTLFGQIETLFYLGKFEFKVPDIEKFKHSYLHIFEESNTVIIDLLDCKASFPIGFDNLELCRIMEEPKLISKEEALKLFKEKKVYSKFLMRYSGSWATVVLVP